MVRPIQFNVPSPPAEPPPFEIKRIDLGLNIRDEQSQIADGQSPYNTDDNRPGVLNMVSDGMGGIQKRKGTQEVYDTTLGAGAVHGYFEYTKQNGTTTILLHYGTKLYTQSGSSQPVEIYSGLADSKGVAFVFGDKWYYIDGTNYIQYDGTTVSAVTGYVPTITLGRDPSAGGGTANEKLNYISNSWKDSFSSTAATPTFNLSYSGLSATTVLVEVEGTALTEGTHFTVDRTNGIVDFSSGTAPYGIPESGTDNVVIQAEKTGLMDSTKIKKNKYAEIFGGQNDTRIFITGNSNAPSTVYWCDIEDPTYWPEDNYNAVGSDSDFNKGLKFQYDQLILLKERSLYRIEYNITDAGVVSFPSYPLNSGIGCDCPDSIQLIDNMIVFLNISKGIYIITRTDVRTEKNVMPISILINGVPNRPGLLDETKANLQLATSFDDFTHYIICVDNKCWAWDYKRSPYSGNENNIIWYYWENINANCWLMYDNVFYYGDRDTGLVYKFTDIKNDNGTAINGVWRSKLFHFGFSEWQKTISYVFFRTAVVNQGNISIKLINDYGETLYTKTITSSSFNWDTFNWDTFNWDVNKFDPVFRLKPKIKKVSYFQIEFSNNTLNEDLSILDLKVYFSLNRKVK